MKILPALERLNPTLIKFIEAQKMSFVATATSNDLVNTSPKGMDTLKVLSENRIVGLNLTDSGNETAAHVREHPRMTLMFCLFDASPLTLPAYGAAKVIHPRQIFNLEVEPVQTACSTGVPIMKFEKPRADEELMHSFQKMAQDGVERYWQRKNSVSLEESPTGIVD